MFLRFFVLPSHDGDVITRFYVNDVASARKKTISFEDFVLQSVRRSYRLLFRPANVL